MDPLTIGLRIGIVLGALAAFAFVYRMEPGGGRAMARLRSRLLFGLPLGTLVSIALVAGFFLFVQGDWGHRTILTLPFTSWSLRYPLGLVTAPVAHQGLGHLVGNLASFLVFGTIGEFAFSHFPTSRGAAAFGSLRSNPYVRAFLIVPAVVLGGSVLTSLFAWGPVIGFSGVGFAAVGFALVHFPVLAVAGLVARGFLRTVFWSFRDPIISGSAGTSYGSPWWADVAIQTHLLGLLLGVALGIALLRKRGNVSDIDPWRLFPASILVGSSLTLWALWWYEGAASYQLFRGPGVILVFGVAVLITAAATLQTSPVRELNATHVSLGLVVFPIVLMAVVAVPVNLTAAPADISTGGPSVTVDGYEIAYGEGVPDPRFDPINISGIDTPDPPTATGVIVTNKDRHIWTEAVSAGRLRNAGQRTVTVGGLGWRKEITVDRTGWRAAGGGRAFAVTATTPTEAERPLFESEPATANTVVTGHELAIAPEDGQFLIKATAANNTTVPHLPDAVVVPQTGNQTTLGALTIVNNQSVIWVEQNDTRVPVFEAEN